MLILTTMILELLVVAGLIRADVTNSTMFVALTLLIVANAILARLMSKRND